MRPRGRSRMTGTEVTIDWDQRKGEGAEESDRSLWRQGSRSGRLAACLQMGDIATKPLEEEALVRQEGLQGFVPIQRLELREELRLVLAEIRDGAVDVLRLKSLTHGDDKFIQGNVHLVIRFAAILSLWCLH